MRKPSPILLPTDATGEPCWLQLVRQHVGSLRYGVVQIVVHDAQVTQIEKTERVRLDNRAITATQARQPAPRATITNA
ncbi:MAG TPA: YezD family protein [Terriglobia bacterium]|nr:YezD family protein [Terriglobia bacterium]